MKELFLLLFALGSANAQEWVKTDYNDPLHNTSGVTFTLAAKEPGAGIQVHCSNGKLNSAWLVTDKIADSYVSESDRLAFLGTKLNTLTVIEYRREDDAEAHKLRLPISNDLRRVLLQQPQQSGFKMVTEGEEPRDSFRGLENLLYGPIGLGGGEWRRNKKSNNYAKSLIVGLTEFAGPQHQFNFAISDPSTMRAACGIK